jgi:sec-independent protein translocase protein TatA
MLHVLAIGMPSGFEWLVVAAIGLLIFGKRLPEVGKSLGKGIVEFKKGLKGIEDEVEEASNQTSSTTRPQITSTNTTDQSAYKFDPETGKPLQTAHKFDPYTGKPLDQANVPAEPAEHNA